MSQTFVTLPLSQGYAAMIDAADSIGVVEFKWTAHVYRNKFGTITGVYAYRSKHYSNPRRSVPLMLHRYLMGFPNGMVDHINHDTLDNRRSNLRVVNKSQNNMNAVKREGCYSKYKGVSWDKSRERWIAYVSSGNGRLKNLGYFISEEDAAKTYNLVAKDLYGEYFRPNIVAEDSHGG